MSQIPDRSPSSIQKLNPVPLSEKEQLPNADCKSFLVEMLSKMVGSFTCSDLSISLDSGESVPAHRFILAAWSSELALLADSTGSIRAPGISKEELLQLLRALYTFDLQFLSSLSPKAEFTLGCWQMLEFVRNKVKNYTFNRRPSSSTNKEPIIRGSTSCNSGVDLFSSVVDSIHQSAAHISLSQETPNSDVERPTTMSDSTLCTTLPYSISAACHSTPHLAESIKSANTPEEFFLVPRNEAENVDDKPNEYLLSLASSPKIDPEIVDNAPDQSPSRPIDSDPPSFCEDFHSFEAQSIPASGQKRTSRHLDEELELHTPTSVGIGTVPSAVPKDSMPFFDASAPTPAPLAERLRASVETVEEAEVVLSLSSQPLPLEYHSSSDKENDDDCSSADPRSLSSLSQLDPCTPIATKRRVTSVILTDVPITPKPDFKAMPTPELRKALSGYGIRRLPKKKAIQLLNHIYDELHPYVEVPSLIEENGPLRENYGGDSPAVSSDTTVSLFSRPINSQNFLESTCGLAHETLEDSQPASRGKTASDQEDRNDALKARVWECLRSNDQLYFNIITYVPLELDCVKTTLRDAGIKVGLRRLSDMLDFWGVTFTTRNRQTSECGTSTSDPTSASHLW
ncbi:hypothetical protein Aperf_G00000132979 [Anoplocephala perfoliata]